jgi:hypothetical protein
MTLNAALPSNGGWLVVGGSWFGGKESRRAALLADYRAKSPTTNHHPRIIHCKLFRAATTTAPPVARIVRFTGASAARR